MRPERTDHNCDGVFSGNYICSHPAHEPGAVPTRNLPLKPKCRLHCRDKREENGAGTAIVPHMQDSGA